ncbi:MAG TPA: hypothetical protein VFM68_02105 [Candidatus Saccharimonadales bacterium]|nr:hypothetical protein [Candidatus Saccharimonadales bacterium]
MSTNQEKINHGPENSFDSARELGHQQSEILRQNAEKAAEMASENNEKSSERARTEALETATSIEKKSAEKEKLVSPASRRGAINKQDLTANYDRTMTQIQSELTPASRAFSKVIHHKAVERTSETLGATIARPNAILAGAIAAFIFTLAMYLIAKNFGYRLSGFETIGGFILGWITGLLFDYFRVLITGKRS